MTEEQFNSDEWRAIGQAIARLRASVMAVTFGIAGGIGLFVATAWLVLRGPTGGAEVVGPTLGLLNNYFPGYSVTWGGAALGFLYGVFVGAVVGYILAWVYNRVAEIRNPSMRRR